MASSGVEIVEIAPVKKGERTVVLGFSGAGFIGSTAVMYIVRNKGFRQRAYVSSQLIPPMMVLIDGRPTHSFRIYGDEKNSLLFVTTETLISYDNQWPVSLKLMEWLAEKGARAFISIEGMPFLLPSEERMVLGFGTGEENLSRFGVQPTREGAISGMNACMLQECMRRGLPWTSLFVPTPLVSAVDYGGSAAVIEVLNRMFKLGVDVTPLRQMAERRKKTQPRGFLGSLRRKK